MHVWALQTCTLQGPGASNTTKIPRKDPQERERKKKIVAGEGKKKREILGLPTLRGFYPLGPPPFGASTLRGLHPSGPPLFLGLGLHLSGPHPSGPYTLWSQNSTSKNGRSRNWPKSKLAELEKKSWPKSKLAEVDRARRVPMLLTCLERCARLRVNLQTRHPLCNGLDRSVMPDL